MLTNKVLFFNNYLRKFKEQEQLIHSNMVSREVKRSGRKFLLNWKVGGLNPYGGMQ